MLPAGAVGAHPAAVAGLQEGNIIVVRYAALGARLWHERLVLSRVPGQPSVGVLTPDDELRRRGVHFSMVDVAFRPPWRHGSGGGS